MLKRACAVLILSGLLAAGSASAAASPHAQARALLTGCLTALRSFPIVKIRSKAAADSRSVKARDVDIECSLVLRMQTLAIAHPADQALQDAYSAAVKLNLAVSDYVQYVLGVTFGRQKLTVLHRAQREIASSKAAAHAALRELG